MRGPFLRALVEVARSDSRVILMTGDLGFAAIEPFAEAFPDRFYNVGVAEQNMVGMATGLAEAGLLPFVYSIASFATRRPYEFIVNGPALHNLPVRIVGIGGGFEYGHAGPTHFGLDDIALMRMLPEMTIIAPADHQQAVAALRQTWNWPGPVYYRLGKDDKATVAGLDGEFEIGRAQRLLSGSDLAFVTLGSIAGDVAAAAAELAERGVQSTLLVVASVRPAPIEDLVETLARVPVVLTVEAHSINGGLGSLVAETIAEHGLPCRLVRCGVEASPTSVNGGNAYWNAMYGLSHRALVERALVSVGALAS